MIIAALRASRGRGIRTIEPRSRRPSCRHAVFPCLYLSVCNNLRLACRGRKVGVFSTRSPHRPNSIGQTVVRYEGFTKFQLPPSPKFAKARFGHALNLSGVDFVDGTPVLDIKPYVAAYDAVPTATMAPWVEQKAASDSALHGAIESVQFSDQARAQLGERLGHMRFYSCVESAEEAVRQVLSLDIHDGSARARKQRRGEAVDADEFCFPFDGLEFIVQRDMGTPTVASAAESSGGDGADAIAGPSNRGGDSDDTRQLRSRLTVVRVVTDDQLCVIEQVAAPTPAPDPTPEPEPEPAAVV